MAFSGLRSVLARVSFFATGDRYSLRKAIRYIPKTLCFMEKEKNEMFANKETESQPHKAKSAIAHIAFLPTLTKLNKEF